MTFALGFAAVSFIIFILFYTRISAHLQLVTKAMENDEAMMESKYKGLLKERKELQEELESLRKKEVFARHGIKEGETADPQKETAAARQKIIDDKVNSLLIKQGTITLEQSESARAKSKDMRMDFLAVCLALDYIDINAAKAVSQTLKLK